MMDWMRRWKWLVLSAFLAVAVSGFLALELAAASADSISGRVIPGGLMAAVTFNVISATARWLLTKTRQRTRLAGPVPLAIGFAKLVGLAVIVMLILAVVAGFAVGAPYGEIALRALVFGTVASAVLMLIANGLLNMIIVFRHFQGTLAVTSRAG